MVVKAVSGGTFVPSDGAVVANGTSVPLSGPDSSQNFATVTTNVSGGSLVRVNLPTGTAVVTNQAGSINVQDADGTQVGASATIVSQTGQLSFVGLPGTAALVTNGMSVQMANFGGAGPVNGVVAMNSGFINWVSLANQTDAIISNSFSTDIGSIAVSPSDDFATVNVSSGALQSVTVSLAPTKTVVTNSQQLTGVAPTGTYTNTVTFTVANGVITGIALS